MDKQVTKNIHVFAYVIYIPIRLCNPWRNYMVVAICASQLHAIPLQGLIGYPANLPPMEQRQIACSVSYRQYGIHIYQFDVGNWVSNKHTVKYKYGVTGNVFMFDDELQLDENMQ